MVATVHQMPVRRCTCGDDTADDQHVDGCPLFESGAQLEQLEQGPAEVVTIPSVSAPLYVVEEELAIWFDTADFVTPDQEASFLVDLGKAMKAAKEKRDSVIQFFSHVRAKRAHIDFEIDRLNELGAMLDRIDERMEGYTIHVLETIGRDPRGRPPRLEGTTGTLTLRACPPSVDIRDEAAIPDDFKTVAPRMPAKLWAEMLDQCDMETYGRVIEAVGEPFATVSRSAVKTAIIDAKIDVPGADLIIGKNSLVIR